MDVFIDTGGLFYALFVAFLVSHLFTAVINTYR